MDLLDLFVNLMNRGYHVFVGARDEHPRYRAVLMCQHDEPAAEAFEETPGEATMALLEMMVGEAISCDFHTDSDT